MTKATTDARKETAAQRIAQAADARELREAQAPPGPVFGRGPMLPKGSKKAQRLTVSLPPDDIDNLRALADASFVGNLSAAATWAIRLAVLALDSEPLRSRRVSSPEDALGVLAGLK